MKSAKMKVIQKGLDENKLKALHADALKDSLRISTRMVKAVFRDLGPEDFKNIYLPISREQGLDLEKIVVNDNCKNIVEFGTSFGISTIYLARAARLTGGKVTTTELLASKSKKALQNIDEAGLSDYVDIKVGDAMETLKEYKWPIDFLFLDGWKDLYLPLFKMLESRFHSQTLIYADNMDMVATRAYAAYVHSRESMYASEYLHDGKGMLTRLI